MKAQEYQDHLRTEYAATTDRAKTVWQTFGNTFTVAVSGILIALIFAVEKYPTSAPVFLVLPFVLVAWYVMMNLQGNELAFYGEYLGLLEEEIRKTTGEPFPCVQSTLLNGIYGSWRFSLLRPLVGMPIVLIYIFIFTAKKSLDYLSTVSLLPFVVGVASLIACPLLAALLTFLTHRALDSNLNRIRARLDERTKDFQHL